MRIILADGRDVKVRELTGPVYKELKYTDKSTGAVKIFTAVFKSDLTNEFTVPYIMYVRTK